MKTCIKCGNTKDDVLFVFNNAKKAYINICRDCMNKYLQEYRIKNKISLKEYSDKKKTSANNKPLDTVGNMKVSIKLLKPTIIIDDAIHNSMSIIKSRRYGVANFPTEDDWLIHKRAYEKKWKDENKSRRIAASIRCKLWELLMGVKDHYSFREMLGCDDVFLRQHLESLFKDGMSWENYGINGWHVDHIIPLCSFDLEDPNQQLVCTHWSNLQPLWWWENLSKGGRVIP